MKLPLGQTLVATAGIIILCSLGTWQIQRMEWKQGLIAKLEADYKAGEENRALFIPDSRLQELATEKQPVAYGTLEGRLLRNSSVLLGPRILDGKMGYNLILPLQMQGGKIILANLGWVDQLWKDNTEERLAFLPAQNVTVRGVIRKPDWSSFASRNSPASDMWFRADIDEISRVKGFTVSYPFMIYAEDVNPPLHDVAPSGEHWLPRNKHLQYAIFWFAMAATLLVVFGFYVKGRRRIS